MRSLVRVASVLVSVVLLAACTPSTETSVSAEPTPSASVSGVGNLAPGCDNIELRAPSGDLVVLNGVWRDDSESTPMTWWIRTQGDCVWGAGVIGEFSAEGSIPSRPHQVQSLSGRVGHDFIITGEIIWLGPDELTLSLPRWAPLRMLIEFGDAGQISLHEDREPGVTGLHCPDPVGYCPDPVVLVPVE